MVPALMEADWSVELGHDDPTLEFPWSSENGSQAYIDLLHQPEAIAGIPEAAAHPELAELLLAINRNGSPWLTVKCDVWLDDELVEAEEIYQSALKRCSYVDLIARDNPRRFSFDAHEQFAKLAAKELSDNDDQPISCEFIVRRCWYPEELSGGAHTPGFSVTVYIVGYGNDDAQARKRWAKGLQRVTSLLAGLAP